MNQGNMIYLNGTCSSGKSSIAKALQEIMDGYYLHTGLDHFGLTLPEGFMVFSDGSNPSAADGILWVFSGEPKRTTDIRIGPVGWRFCRGMYRAWAALASAGNDVIIEDVIFDQRILREAVDALHMSSSLSERNSAFHLRAVFEVQVTLRALSLARYRPGQGVFAQRSHSLTGCRPNNRQKWSVIAEQMFTPTAC